MVTRALSWSLPYEETGFCLSGGQGISRELTLYLAHNRDSHNCDPAATEEVGGTARFRPLRIDAHSLRH